MDTARPGYSASDRKAGGPSTAARNFSKRAGGKAGFALEDSTTGKASRKSTRKGANRIKPDANLARQATRASRTPGRRARAGH